ncbi:DUF2934 domain-containing protein [Rhizobium terrae]|uniref:DUF2934 domain-containing protein n=1 Tax=Rhizobium terrae TaxID=2171756 RepID=UPI0038578F4B
MELFRVASVWTTGRMETIMAESEDEWIRKRAYALWEEEGYPAGKDREHWERAKLEYATLGPVPSSGAARGRKTSAAIKPPGTAPKAASSSKAPAVKTLTAKAPAKAASSAKTNSKPPAAMPESVEPAKRRSKKVPVGE